MPDINKAVLLSIDWKNEQVMTTIAGEPFFDNPIRHLELLKSGIKKDWPGWDHYVIGTERAMERMRTASEEDGYPGADHE